jgi:uncharacterized protein
VALRDLRGLVVIDEIQHAPDLFKVLRVLIDRPGLPARFLLLGSGSPALLRQSSESLAGRIEIIEIGGFTLDETGIASAPALWLRGGFPRSFTAPDDGGSAVWRRTFIRRQPWFANLGKRQVKAPKIYLRDSGLLHSLLGIGDAAELVRHPKSGASWKGFALDQLLRIARPEESYFWATHAGAELDLLMIKGNADQARRAALTST